MNKKYNKYKNIPTECNNIMFDSKKEAGRYKELTILQLAKRIKNLKRQVKFELIPAFEKKGIKYRSTNYIADFTYFDVHEGVLIAEDVKSPITRINPVYRLKKKLFAYFIEDYKFLES
jgi:hypothetical protein